MQGLRTDECEKFEKYFAIIQEDAKRLGGVFFMESEEGKNLYLEDIEVCDAGGWLVPFDEVEKFEPLYLAGKDRILWDEDRWYNMYIFVDYILDENNNVSVKFDKYDYEIVD